MKEKFLRAIENPKLMFNLGLAFFIGITCKMIFIKSPNANLIFIGTTLIILSLLTFKDLRKKKD